MTPELDPQERIDAELYDKRASTYGHVPGDLDHSIPAELESPYRLDLEVSQPSGTGGQTRAFADLPAADDGRPAWQPASIDIGVIADDGIFVLES